MSAPKVSVILPVYNPGPGIHKCIESLRAQLLDDLEFIFVDDCSTDGSMGAVEAWAAGDDRVRILRNEENLGAGPSRNRGIEEAQGDYLSFVDPDDYVSPDFYELLYAAATSGGGHDIAKGTRAMVDELGCALPLCGEPLNARIRRQLERGSSLYAAFTYEHQTALYRRALFANANVRYGTSRNSQDTTFLLACCLHTDDLVFEEAATYFYVQREGSAIRRDGVARSNSEIDAAAEKISLLEAHSTNREARQYMRMQVHTGLRRFQDLLGKGLVARDDYAPIADRLTSLLRRIPKIERECADRPQLKELLEGRPLTTPGLRQPGEGDVRISVILPVYNPGPGIAKCIESLRAQLLDGLEFIFVDDCSTDGSMGAVEAWAAEDDRVRILRNDENLGAGPSRNRGIEASRGGYLSFVDPDDYVALDFCELLYAAATAGGGHDIAKGGCQKVDADGNPAEPRSTLNERIGSALARREPLFTIFRYEHWSAIYHRRLFSSGAARYGTSRNGQDVTFLLRCTRQTNDLVRADRALYYYVRRPGSAVDADGSRRTEGELDMLSEMVDSLGQNPTNEERGYLLGQAKNVLNRHLALLDEGRARRESYQRIAKRLADVMGKIPRIRELAGESALFVDALDGCPLTTPGFRRPGERDVRISVILPVYNPGPGIHKCIESLRAQLLDGLEFIFVDDCSTDGSIAEVEAWAAEDPRVRILRNDENLGAGPSRNRGIEAAQGDYLSFVDPDDCVTASFYLLLYAAATAGDGHDMAKGVREVIALDGTRSQGSGKLVNEQIRAALRGHAPLYAAFSSEHTTAIYRRSLFDRGARNGTSRKDEDTTFLLSACLLSEDIVLEEAAVYRYVMREGSSVNGHQLSSLMGELDSIAEKAALLGGRRQDVHMRRYLKTRIALRITNYYVGIRRDPLLADAMDDYVQKLGGVIDQHQALAFLKSASPFYSALAEHRMPLPLVDDVPDGLKPEGARDWMHFIERTPDAKLIQCVACARAQEAALRHIAQEEGLGDFRAAYSQTISRIRKLPPKQGAVMLLELHRKLASWHNIRKALGRVRQKVRH